jgi:hypothetical protein
MGSDGNVTDKDGKRDIEKGFGHIHALFLLSSARRWQQGGLSAMEWARSSRRRVFKVQRDCERSRVQDELVVAAYELAVPLVRRRLSAAKARSASCNSHHSASQSPVVLEGVSA